MVAVFTGVLSLFRDFGLSAGAVQRSDITPDRPRLFLDQRPARSAAGARDAGRGAGHCYILPRASPDLRGYSAEDGFFVQRGGDAALRAVAAADALHRHGGY